MRILMLNYEFPPLGGGAANACYYLLKELANNTNYEVDLITSSVDRFKVEEFSEKISIHYLDIKKRGSLQSQTSKDLLTYSWKAYWYAKKIIKKSDYNFIHAFFGIPCGFIAMKLSLPYIVSLRGSDVPFHNEKFAKLDRLIFKRLSKKIWQKSGAVVSNSEGLKKTAQITSPSQKISVIYNGVNTDEFAPPTKRQDGARINLISTGRLSKIKGYKYLIEALSDMNDFKLTLVGDGDLKMELQELSRRLNVDVQFAGNVEHSKILNYLQEADIFVLSSLNEGMSNSVLEAMACGLPIIATNVGGSKELVSENGIIVNKGSTEELRKALITYKDNKELLKRHSVKSRERALTMSWKVAVEQYDSIYKLL